MTIISGVERSDVETLMVEVVSCAGGEGTVLVSDNSDCPVVFVLVV